MVDLVAMYVEDLNEHTSIEARQAVRRYWFRAVCLTLLERSLVHVEIPRRRTNRDYVSYYEPFWRNRSDAELFALYNLLDEYYNHAQRKKIDLLNEDD